MTAIALKVIDGRNYEFYHISARKLNSISLRLGKILLPVLSVILKKDMGTIGANGLQRGILDIKSSLIDVMDGGIDIEEILAALVKNADEAIVQSIIDDLLSKTICIGIGNLWEEDKFDKAFCSNIFLMYKVAKEAFLAYFADFLAESQGNEKQ